MNKLHWQYSRDSLNKCIWLGSKHNIFCTLFSSQHTHYPWTKFIGIPPPKANRQNDVYEEIVDILLWTWKYLGKGNYIGINCDKGHRKGDGHFPKIVSWSCQTREKSMKILI